MKIETLLPAGQRVSVYKTLDGSRWIVMKEDRGIDVTIARVSELVLSFPQTHINERIRKIALEKGIKNVHAGIVGYIASDLNVQCSRQVDYHPKRPEGFFFCDNQETFVHGKTAHFVNRKLWVTPAD